MTANRTHGTFDAVIGAVFGQHERMNSQTELVIFLRPIVVANPSLESDELRGFQRLLPAARSQP